MGEGYVDTVGVVGVCPAVCLHTLSVIACTVF